MEPKATVEPKATGEPTEETRRFWDTDASTYDLSSSHNPTTALEQATWSAVLERLLPPVPARVLDVGAGTGFLSLLAARLGHQVTALDFSGQMLQRLRDKAAADGLEVEAVEGAAEAAPSGRFDAVIERHVVWTLPDPVATLDTWRAAAPEGRLLLFGSAWGNAADPREALRARLRTTMRRLKGVPSDHHESYSPEMVDALPHGTGISAEQLVELVRSSHWGPPRVERLRDVEWSTVQAGSGIERLLGATPRYVVIAG